MITMESNQNYQGIGFTCFPPTICFLEIPLERQCFFSKLSSNFSKELLPAKSIVDTSGSASSDQLDICANGPRRLSTILLVKSRNIGQVNCRPFTQKSGELYYTELYSLWRIFQHSYCGFKFNLHQVSFVHGCLVWCIRGCKATKPLKMDFLRDSDWFCSFDKKKVNEEKNLMALCGFPTSFSVRSKTSSPVQRTNERKCYIDTNGNSIGGKTPYKKRFYLFSKYAKGIKMDESSWFDATPERFAIYIAKKLLSFSNVGSISGTDNSHSMMAATSHVVDDICKDTPLILNRNAKKAGTRPRVVVDLFCGVGSNTIQFALFFDHVIAIDIDPIRIEMARYNATIYNVADKITFICEDAITWLNGLITCPDVIIADCIIGNEQYRITEIDSFFLSPPWGLNYRDSHRSFCLKEIVSVDVYTAIKLCCKLSSNVTLYLPRTQNLMEIALIAALLGIRVFECEELWYFNRKNVKVLLFYLCQDLECYMLDIFKIKKEKKVQLAGALNTLLDDTIMQSKASKLADKHECFRVCLSNLLIAASIADIVALIARDTAKISQQFVCKAEKLNLCLSESVEKAQLCWEAEYFGYMQHDDARKELIAFSPLHVIIQGTSSLQIQNSGEFDLFCQLVNLLR